MWTGFFRLSNPRLGFIDDPFLKKFRRHCQRRRFVHVCTFFNLLHLVYPRQQNALQWTFQTQEEEQRVADKFMFLHLEESLGLLPHS